MKELFQMIAGLVAKKAVIISTVVVVTMVGFCSSLYVIQLKDGTYDDSTTYKGSNVPYIVQDAIGNIFSGEESMDELGEILTTKSPSGHGWTLAYRDDDDQIKPIDLDIIADKIITKCQKNHTVLENYIKDVKTISKDGKTLRTSETIKLMIKAQLVTQYPDLRNKDYIRTAVGTDELQGCIKFIRNKYNEATTLEYIPLGKEDDEGETTLYGLINKANKKTADQELGDGYTGKDKVFNYFSLDTSGNLIIVEEERTDTKAATADYIVGYAEEEVSEEDYKSYVWSDRNNSKIVQVRWNPQWKYKIKTINYSTAVSRYTMPFEYLWAFLVCGRDEQFIRDFANYVLDSEIDIGIYDNIASEESEAIKAQANTNTWTRHKTITKTFTNGVLTSTIDSGWRQPYEKALRVPRHAEVSRKMEYFDTIEISIITANIWSMKFYEIRSYIKPEHSNPDLAKFVVERKDPDDPEQLWGPDVLEGTSSSSSVISIEPPIIETIEIEKWKSTSIWQNQKAETYSDKEHDKTQDRVEYYYQVSRTGTIKKDDKTVTDGDEFYPNFCTLYNESGQEKYNLENSMQWFFEVLANNSSTVNFLPMTKYMLNKATGKDYGTTSVNFSLYDGGDLSKITFASITNSSGGIDVSSDKYFPKSTEQFRNGVKAYKHNDILLQYAEAFMEYQEKYGVNAFFAATVSVWETGAGTAGHGSDGKNNMFNIRNNSEFRTYSDKKQGIDAFYKLISGGTYFGSGKTPIANIGYTYCPNSEVSGQADRWIRSVQSTMVSMLKKANIDISLINDMTIQEANRGEAKIYQVVFKGVTYITPINLGTNGIAVSSVAGFMREVTTNNGKQNRIHYGTDIASPKNQPIYASADGTISLCGYQDASNHGKGYGLRVYINHGNGIQTIYAHGSALAEGIRQGVNVKKGQIIMYSGNSGNTTGPHLHFEMKAGSYRYVDTTNAICGKITKYGVLSH